VVTEKRRRRVTPRPVRRGKAQQRRANRGIAVLVVSPVPNKMKRFGGLFGVWGENGRGGVNPIFSRRSTERAKRKKALEIKRNKLEAGNVVKKWRSGEPLGPDLKRYGRKTVTRK